MIKIPLASGKFYFERPASWATSAHVLGEPEIQGETTNLQTAEGMILTPKNGKIDKRRLHEEKKEGNLQDTANLGYCYAKVDWTMLK